jgi:uncharacterized protein YcaQ
LLAKRLDEVMDRISELMARRIALAAQGIGRARPELPARRHVLGIVQRLGAVQIDSVNVLTRAHYMPAFSRLGTYPRGALDTLAWGNKRERALFEYWGHEASLLPFAMQPLFRWRMARAERGQGLWSGLARFAAEHKRQVAAALAEIRTSGVMAAADLAEAGASKSTWWGWSDGKKAFEYLFWSGQLAVAGRRGNFERLYDLPERVLPVSILAAPTPDEADAQRALVAIAARALGIGTAGDFGRYFRLGPEAGGRVAELVETGELIPVEVTGWGRPAYLHQDAVIPRKMMAQALVSPFDPLLWERDRAERLFGFHYRIEIYVRAENRLHGYYVLPFLLGDRFVARVDLKADRHAGTLHVLAAHMEEAADLGAVAEALTTELSALAAWLGLDRVEIARRGDLAPALKAQAAPVAGKRQ